MSSQHNGRVALVTGAGKGLGAAFARALAAEGAAVIVNNRRHDGQPSSADAITDQIRASGGTAEADYNDVTAPGAADAMVAAALARFGRLDALVLNAGIMGPAAKLGTGVQQALTTVMQTNFFAAAGLAEAALAPLMAGSAGRIVFIASTAGLHGVRGRTPYAASKGALHAFALTLADEVKGTALRVNTYCPYAETAMTARTGIENYPAFHPDHAAAMVVYLAGPACACNGETFVGGARYYRMARMFETSGVAAPDDDPNWIAANLDRIMDQESLSRFAGAEGSYYDILGKVTAPDKG